LTLAEYRRKRDFLSSPEPVGKTASIAGDKDLRFVVQKHDARNLNYDFRLEHEGVLKSWAVPRGPSLNPAVKRLAVEVEDHPLAYANFEGVIPEGHYGAGKVIVWDNGIWQPHEDVSKMLRSGRLKFKLSGHRLRGEWVLVRTHIKGKQQQWLLSKKNDDESRKGAEIVDQHLASVLEKHQSNDRNVLPDFIMPKLPTLTTDSPQGEGWIHELKMDGYRMQAQWRNNGFRLLTRAGHDWTHRYPVIADELSRLDLEGTIIDGELTALDVEGKSNFDLLQHASGNSEVALAYFAFDLLYLRGQDQREKI